MTQFHVALVLSWAVALLAAWLGYQLVSNNRRLLTCLDSAERGLEEAEKQIELKKIQAEGLPVGTQAPAFELPDLDGKPVSLDQFRGQGVLLVFFSPECGYCTALAPDLARLAWGGSDGGPVPVVVSTGDPEANRALVAEHGIRCPVLIQVGAEVSSRYKVPGTPVGYLIDEGGVTASRMVAGGPGILALAEAPNAATNGTSRSGDAADTALENLEITVGSGQDRGRRTRRRGGGLDPGTVAPRFTLPRLDGGRLSLDDYRGRRLLLVFSDPDCSACERILPELEQVHQHAPDLPIVMVSRGEPDENRLKVAALGLTFPVVLQRRWDLSRQYWKFATPAAYLIDENGLIASRVAAGGAILALALQAAEYAPQGHGGAQSLLSHSREREG
jgi:peroxiredoxin